MKKIAWTLRRAEIITIITYGIIALLLFLGVFLSGCNPPSPVDADGNGMITGKIFWKSQGTCYLVANHNGRVSTCTWQPPAEVYEILHIGSSSTIMYKITPITEPSTQPMLLTDFAPVPLPATAPVGPGINERSSLASEGRQ